MVNNIYNPLTGQITQTGSVSSPSVSGVSKSKSSNFKDLLLDQLKASDTCVKFSKHALERMEQRGLKLTDEQIQKIGDYIDKAAEKGSKESVFVLDGMSMVVGVDNRTVITCMDAKDMQQNILTNVDSVAFLY